MIEKIKQLLTELTLEEKAGLCSGFDFWTTKPVSRLGIPSARMADGPHGLRKENDEDESVGAKMSFPATAFPPAVNQASSWNPELVEKMGECLADQCKDQEVSTILGPGVNIKRNPRCGRNFEYFSEDPFLSGKMSVSYINGVQKLGISTSLKHFCANSQERLRMVINEVVDERALRELYLPAFEMSVKEAQPKTVMCSYNRLNGVYLSDNKRLLTDILRDEWGFEGLVVSDWNATNNRVEGVRAGMDLEMPASCGSNDRKIVAAVKDGSLSIEELDIMVERILKFVFECHSNLAKEYVADYDYAHNLAREIAEHSFVLMKNEKDLLPIKDEKLVIIGAMADHIRYQGAGSSKINPYKLVSLLEACNNSNVKYDYYPGYSISGDGLDQAELDKAVVAAKNADKIVVCMGLTDNYESEGYDRTNILIPNGQIKLIEELSKVNDKIAVILFGGSPVQLDWTDNIKTLLNVYLPGEAGGEAILNTIIGKVNPSGKLAETYPIALSDYMPDKYYGCGPRTVEHRESFFVGYRYYDKANKIVKYPFGHGLSYTKFEYSDLTVNGDTVTFTVTNIGNYDGYEVSQLYIAAPKSKLLKPVKELKGFAKTFIKVGESKTVTITLNERSFSYYNTKENCWSIEGGDYEILIGASSRDIKLSTVVNKASDGKQIPDYSNCQAYFNLDSIDEIPASDFEELYGDKLPSNLPKQRGEYDHNTTIGEFSSCIIGKIFVKLAPAVIKSQVKNADYTTMLMLQQGMTEMPLRGLKGITSGLLDDEFIEGMLMWGNKKRFVGFFRMLWGMLMSLRNIIRKDNSNKERRALIKAEQEKKAAEKAKLREQLKKEKLEAKEKLKEAKSKNSEEEIAEAKARQLELKEKAKANSKFKKNKD